MNNHYGSIKPAAWAARLTSRSIAAALFLTIRQRGRICHNTILSLGRRHYSCFVAVTLRFAAHCTDCAGMIVGRRRWTVLAAAPSALTTLLPQTD